MNVSKNHKVYAALMLVQILLILAVVIGGFVITYNILSFIPALLGVCIGFMLAVVLSEYYYAGAAFMCPDCGKKFKPSRSDFMKSVHGKKGRKFCCPACNKVVVCKEGFKYGDTFK